MIQNVWTRFVTLVLGVFFSVAAFAQEKAEINVDVNKGNGGNWYAQPWVWIVGAAIFILLLVALLRGNSSKE